MRHWKCGPWTSALTLLLFCAAPGKATLYGVNSTGTLNGQLITINTVTGAGTVVGMLASPVDANDLAFRGNNLYIWDTDPNRLRQIDPANGATLTIIDLGIGASAGEGGLAFRADGMGFVSASQTTPFLRRFDITLPGSSTVITNSLTPLMDGLAFNAAGVLYGLEEGGAALYTIDQVTGATTLVGSTGITGTNMRGGLAFDASGQLFAVSSGAISTLYRLNSTTGASTLVGNIGFGAVTGIAFGPGVTITQSGGSTTVTEGGATDSYTVVLDTPPTANVTITINPGAQVTVVPASLTFTPANWNTPQTVTVTAADDALVEGAHTGTITHTAASTDTNYNAVAIASVTANISDNDGGPPPILYGVTYLPPQLITINTTTGAGTLVGPIAAPGARAAGVAFRGTQLYMYDGFGDLLHQVNPTTAAIINTINLAASIGGEGDLAFRSDGIGFLVSGGGGTLTNLIRFDLTVPNSTFVGNHNPAMDGAVFDAAGVLYGLNAGGDSLYTINPATAATTLIGSTGISPAGIQVGGLTFDGSGNLFAVVSSLGNPSNLYRLNAGTGTATLVGNIGFDTVSGLAVAQPPLPPPPPPAPPGPPPGDGAEGSFDGSGGASGPEGGFGFGGRVLLPAPLLWGPVVDTLNPTNLRVYNVSHRARGQPLSATREVDNAQDDLLAWMCGLSVALGLGLLLTRAGRG